MGRAIKGFFLKGQSRKEICLLKGKRGEEGDAGCQVIRTRGKELSSSQGRRNPKKGRPTYANCAPISNEEVKCLLGLDGMVFLCLFWGGLRRLPVLRRDQVSCVSGGGRD